MILQSFICGPRSPLITVTAAPCPVLTAALVVQRPRPIHLMWTLVLTDMSSEPAELIRAFDPLMKGGSDSRTTWAAFNQAWRRMRWAEASASGICALVERTKITEGISRQALLPYPILSNYRASRGRLVLIESNYIGTCQLRWPMPTVD